MKRKSLLIIAMTLILATVLNMFAGVAVFADTTGVIEIDTAEELAAVKNDLAGSYKLTADISLLDADGNKTEWDPIGTGESDTAVFSGTFDGNGHTVSGFKVTSNSAGGIYIGFFGLIGDGEVKNLTIANADFRTSDASYEIGAIAGRMKGTSTIANCTTESSVTVATHSATQAGNVAIGGIVGYQNDLNCTVSHCVNNASVSAVIPSTGKLEWVGGIVGSMYKGTATYCINNGDVSVTGSPTWGPYKLVCGGIVGRAHDQSSGWKNRTVSYCVNFGDVTGARSAGGILGATSAEGDPKGIYLNNNFNFGYVNGIANTGLISGCHGKDNSIDVANNFSVKIGDAGICPNNHAGTIVETAAELKQNDTYKAIIEAVEANNPTFDAIHTELVGYQTTAVGTDNEFDVRLVATLREYYLDGYQKCANVGFKVSAKYTDAEGNPQTKTPDGGEITMKKLYTSITATDGAGNENTTTTHTADSLGGDYIFVLVCQNLPADVQAGTKIEFTVTTFYTEVGVAESVYGEEIVFAIDVPADTVA